MVHPRGDIPVNRTDVIARLVFAHFVEVHALALEDAVIRAGEGLGDHAVGAQFDLPDFFDDFAGDHAGSEAALKLAAGQRRGSEGMVETVPCSVVPTGLKAISNPNPALKRRAILVCPSGTMGIVPPMAEGTICRQPPAAWRNSD